MAQDFSVLMSVYAKDKPAWVSQALDSVLANTAKPKEIITVIDGPVPSDLQKVLTDFSSKHPQIKLFPLAKNGGLGPALAYGLQKCSCELIARMDADDIALPDRFEKQLTYFEKHPNTAVLGGQIQEIDGETLTPVAIRKVPLTNKEIRQYIKMRSPFNHMTVMFKKSAVLAAGSYGNYYFMQDYFLWAHMAAKGFEMANLPDILVNARVNDALYKRRGGWNYFQRSRAISNKLLELGLISYPRHLLNLGIRFGVQVLIPTKLRGYFYKKALR